LIRTSHKTLNGRFIVSGTLEILRYISLWPVLKVDPSVSLRYWINSSKPSEIIADFRQEVSKPGSLKTNQEC